MLLWDSTTSPRVWSSLRAPMWVAAFRWIRPAVWLAAARAARCSFRICRCRARTAASACWRAAEALSARRAFLVAASDGRASVVAAHIDAGESTSLTVSKDVLVRASRGDAMALDGAAAAPVGEADLLWVDGRERP